MVHIHYDFSLVVGSIAVAILASYLAISTQQFLLGESARNLKKPCSCSVAYALALLFGVCILSGCWLASCRPITHLICR